MLAPFYPEFQLKTHIKSKSYGREHFIFSCLTEEYLLWHQGKTLLSIDEKRFFPVEEIEEEMQQRNIRSRENYKSMTDEEKEEYREDLGYFTEQGFGGRCTDCEAIPFWEESSLQNHDGTTINFIIFGYSFPE